MNSKVTIIVYGLIAIYFLSQVAECKSGSKLMKYGKKFSQKIGHYAKPLLTGTERTAGKLTRDVGTASRYTARNAINGLLLVNRRLRGVLKFAKRRIAKKKAAPPPPPPAAEPAVEEHVDDPAPEEHHDEPVAEEHPEEPAAEVHEEEPAAEEHHDEPAAEVHEEEPAAEEHHDEPA